jgi:hypothetical protein
MEKARGWPKYRYLSFSQNINVMFIAIPYNLHGVWRISLACGRNNKNDCVFMR